MKNFIKAFLLALLFNFKIIYNFPSIANLFNSSPNIELDNKTYNLNNIMTADITTTEGKIIKGKEVIQLTLKIVKNKTEVSKIYEKNKKKIEQFKKNKKKNKNIEQLNSKNEKLNSQIENIFKTIKEKIIDLKNPYYDGPQTPTNLTEEHMKTIYESAQEFLKLFDQLKKLVK